MNDTEFWNLKLLKVKYRRGDQRIQLSAILVLRKKLGSPSLMFRNLKTLGKVQKYSFIMENALR